MTFYRRQRMLFTKRKKIDPWVVLSIAVIVLFFVSKLK